MTKLEAVYTWLKTYSGFKNLDFNFGISKNNNSVLIPAPNDYVVYEDITGTKSTLTRSEVRGHAKKPWKQKHTGHARQGSTKGPQFVGGGVVFAPKPRDFSKKVNKFARRTALVSALSQKLAQNEVVILDKFALEQVKTKEVQKFLDWIDTQDNAKNYPIFPDNCKIEYIKNLKNLPTTTAINNNLARFYNQIQIRYIEQ